MRRLIAAVVLFTSCTPSANPTALSPSAPCNRWVVKFAPVLPLNEVLVVEPGWEPFDNANGWLLLRRCTTDAEANNLSGAKPKTAAPPQPTPAP